MATAVNKTIGTGKDYATLNLAKAANHGASGASLVAADEVVTNTAAAAGNLLTAYFDQNGLTTDATRFLTIGCAEALRHTGIYPTDRDFTGLAYALQETDAAVLLQDDYTVLQDSLIVQRPTGGYPSAVYVTGDKCLIQRCIIVADSRGRATTENYGLQWNIGAGKTLTVRNCVIICVDDDNVSIRYGLYQGTTTGGVVTLENCTVYSSDKGAYIRANGGLVLKNTVIRGTPGSTAPDGGYDINNFSFLGGASTNNAYRDSGAHVDLTGVSDEAIFVNGSKSVFDYRPRLGGVLRGKGADLTGTFTDDIVGSSRSGVANDIGAFQETATTRRKFIVTLSDAAPTRVDGKTNMIIEADTPAAAVDMANVQYDQDAPWNDPVELTNTPGYAGARFDVNIGDTIKVSYTALLGDSLDAIGAALAALLNADRRIANASYATSTNILTAAGAADNFGDKTLVVTVTPEGAVKALQASSGPVGEITDGGAAGAALKVQFYDNGIPKLDAKF
jgi:hypothetical protein